MQPYTHFLIGVVGSVYSPTPLGKLLFIGASIAPDIPMVLKMVEGKLRGADTLTEQSEGFVRVKNITHSIPLATATLVVGLWLPLLIPVGIGWLIHCVIDLLTHGKKSYGNDQLFLWPMRWEIACYCGLWEYRYGHGILWPKPFEAGVDAILIALALLWYHVWPEWLHGRLFF